MRYVWRRRCTPSSKRCTLFFGWFGFSLLMVWWVCYVPVAASVRHVWAGDDDNDNDGDLGGARAEVHRDDERRGRGELGGLVHEHPGVGRVRPKGRDLLEGARSARDEAGGGQEHGAPDFTKSSSSCKGSLASLNISMEGRLYDMTERASRGVTSAHSRDQPAILSRGEALCSPSRGQTVIRDAVNAAAINR